MKLYSRFFLVVLLFLMITSGSAQTQTKLESVISRLEQKQDWKDVEIGKTLREVTLHPSGETELVNAKILLIAHLISADTKESLAEACEISRSLAQAEKHTWQRDLAVFYAASILGLQGEYEKQREAVEFALSSINFADLEQSSDPVFTKLQTLFSTKPSDLKDALHLMMANICLKKGNIGDAELSAEKILSRAMRESVSGQIHSQKLRSHAE